MGDMGWTDVTVALPKAGKTVLAWAADGKDQTKDLMKQVYFDGRDYVFGYHNNRMWGVTHWMEMPTPPETE
jgi:hypothetical protein